MSGMITAVIGSTVVGGLMADDNGAEGANDAAAASTRLQGEISKDQWDSYKRIYQPKEEQYVNESFNYDTPERRAQAIAEDRASANADTQQSWDRARGQAQRGILSRMGATLNPAQLAQQEAQFSMGEAADRAGNMNKAGILARNRIQDLGRAYKTDALSLGKGLAASAGTMAGSSASNSAAIARNGIQQSANQGASIGRLTDRLFNPSVIGALSGGSSANPYAGGSDQWTGGSNFAWD